MNKAAKSVLRRTSRLPAGVHSSMTAATQGPLLDGISTNAGRTSVYTKAIGKEPYASLADSLIIQI